MTAGGYFSRFRLRHQIKPNEFFDDLESILDRDFVVSSNRVGKTPDGGYGYIQGRITCREIDFGIFLPISLITFLCMTFGISRVEFGCTEFIKVEGITIGYGPSSVAGNPDLIRVMVQNKAVIVELIKAVREAPARGRVRGSSVVI